MAAAEQVTEIGFATQLIERVNGSWRVDAHDLTLLESVLSHRTLWAFCRCFEAGDRLLSIGQLILLNDQHNPWEIGKERNLRTLVWIAAGSLREFAKAVWDLRSVRRLLDAGGLRKWYRLEAIARRWDRKPLARVRNLLSFHLDEHAELFRQGMRLLLKEGNPVTVVKADTPTHGSSSFCLGATVMINGMWNDPVTATQDFTLFADQLLRDHQALAEPLQEIFAELLLRGRTITVAGQLAAKRRELLRVLALRMAA